MISSGGGRGDDVDNAIGIRVSLSCLFAKNVNGTEKVQVHHQAHLFCGRRWKTGFHYDGFRFSLTLPSIPGKIGSRRGFILPM